MDNSERPEDANRTNLTPWGRPRMARADRAKIFIPFNPLKGFQEALRAKEAERDAMDEKMRSPYPIDDHPEVD